MHARTNASRNNRLVGLNAALLGVLAVVTIAGTRAGGSTREAQPSRARGSYTMVSGAVQGDTAQAVYILDSVNQELLALRWNRNSSRFEGIGYRSLTADAQTQQQGR